MDPHVQREEYSGTHRRDDLHDGGPGVCVCVYLLSFSLWESLSRDLFVWVVAGVRGDDLLRPIEDSISLSLALSRPLCVQMNRFTR